MYVNAIYAVLGLIETSKIQIHCNKICLKKLFQLKIIGYPTDLKNVFSQLEILRYSMLI